MRLNLDIIADHLPKKYRVHRYGPKNRKLLYGPPVPYETGRIMEPAYLYIAPANALRQLPRAGCAAICVGGQAPKSWVSGGVQLLHIEGTTDIYGVLHDILAIYDKFREWDHQLRDQIDNATEFDLRQFLILGSEMLDNPIGISDQMLRGLYRTEIIQQPNGVKEIRLLQMPPSHTPDAEYMEAIKEVWRVEREIRNPYLTMAPNLKNEEYCINLYPMGFFLGCANFSASRHLFRESDFALMDFYFAYLQNGYWRYVCNVDQRELPRTSGLKKLLSHEILLEEELEALTRKNDEVFFCIKLKERRGGRCLLKDYMSASLVAVSPFPCSVVIHHEEIVGLLQIKHDHQQQNHALEEIKNTLGEYMRKMGYLCGISNRFTDIGEFDSYLQQASYAAEQGYQDANEQTVHFFKDYMLQYILCECANHLPTETLLTQGLQAMHKLDRQKGTDYVRTLDIYLQSECNASKAAELLYIHRSSLMKRLDKIQRFLAMDLENSDNRLYLRICLRILNLMDI